MNHLIGNLDATAWALEFTKRYPEFDMDTAIAWFANAIMAGYDRKNWDNEARISKLEKVVEAAMFASKAINNHYLKEPPHDEDLWFARDDIDIALKELDGGEK